MKIKKNFLKKLTAGILGFVMTLGVGAAGYSASASEARAGSLLYTCASSGNAGSASDYTKNSDIDIIDNDHEITWNVCGNNTTNPWSIGGKSITNVDRTIYTKDPIDFGDIDEVKITTTGGSSCTLNMIKVEYSSNSEFTNSLSIEKQKPSSGDLHGTQSFKVSGGTFGTSKYFKFHFYVTVSNSSNKKFTLNSIAFYGTAPSAKTLTSIAISGVMSTKTYTIGSSFSPAGLVATGTYDDASTDDISASVEWRFNPNTATSGTSSVSVTASLDGITSPSYSQTGITVTSKPEFELVTSENQLTVGSKYLLSSDKGNSKDVYVVGKYAGGNNFPAVSTTTNASGKITESDTMGGFILGGAKGAWTFQESASGTYNNQYWYAAGGTSNNYMKTRAANSSGDSAWTISIGSDSTATIKCTNTSTTKNLIKKNTSSALFSCYGSGQSPVYLFKEVNIEPTFGISPDSLTLHLYGTGGQADLVTTNVSSPSFTVESYSVAGIATAVVNGTKLNVSANGEGSTVVTVKETTSNKTATLTVTVDRIPYSATMLESVELESGGSSTSKFKKLSTLLQVYDKRGDEIDLKDCSITWAPQSSSVVGFTDGRIFGKTAGTATVTATITVPGGDPIVKSCAATVLDDYPYSDSWNFDDSGEILKEYYAGDAFNPNGLVAKYKTYFHHGSSDPYYTMSNNNLTFTTSSDGTRKSSSYVFSQDDVGTGKTIYVYYGNGQITTITGITVITKDIPLTSLSFSEGASGELTRGDSLTLHPVFNPTNATMGRNLTWTPASSVDGVTVSQSGVISVATNAIPGSKVTVTATTDYKPEGSSEFIKATYEVTVKRETQKVHVVQSTPETWDIADSISAGDEIALVAYWQRWEFNGTISSNRGGYITYGEEKGDDPTGIYTLIVEENDGLYAFYHKNEDGTKTYINQKGADNKMDLTSTAHYFSVSFSDYDDIYLSFTDSNNKSRTLVANSSSSLSGGRFAFYLDSSAIKDKSGGEPNSNYELVTAYKKSGGTVESDETVSDTLYSAVMAATPYLNSDWSMVQSKLQTIITTAGLDYTILQHGVKNALGNEVEQFLAAYDNLVLNSGKTDFLHRFKTYTVSFETQCEAQISPVSVMEGGKITAPQQPENPGHTFNGWYLGDDEFDFNTEITADITLTADWTINQYSISYAENSHVSISGTSSFEYGASNVSVSLVADNGYSLPASVTATCNNAAFNDFTYSNGTFALTGTMPAGNITISGNGTANVYNITYNMKDGTNNPDNPSTYTVEDAITLKDPTKDGCTFGGWSPSGSITKGSTGDKVFTASWNPITYNVSFTGTNATLSGDTTCAFGSTYSGTIVVQSPYHLPGSISVKCGDNDVPYNYNNSTGELLFTMPAGNVTITANATSDYAISYFEVDGTAITGDYLINSYQEGVGVTLVNAHDKTGYVFAGWYNNAQLTGSPVTVISTQDTGPKTFYAKWTYAGQDALDCVSTNLGVSYTYSKDGGNPVVSKAASSDEVEYDFTKIPGFSQWDSSYSSRTVEYTEATVKFASANKQSSNITDRPVSKGADVEIIAKEGKTMATISAQFLQWTTKTQDITMFISSDGGETYIKVEGKKWSNFSVDTQTLPKDTNAVKFSFSSSSNQIGFTSMTVTYAPEGPTYDSTFKFNVKNTGLSSLISMYSGAYDDMGIAVSYTDSNNNDRVRYFSFIADEYGKFWVKEAGKDPIEFKFNKDGTSFALNLGDVLNNIDVANIEFTVQAYIYEGGVYHLSENKTTMSLMDWIDGYYAIPKYQAAVKEIHDILHDLLGE